MVAVVDVDVVVLGRSRGFLTLTLLGNIGRSLFLLGRGGFTAASVGSKLIGGGRA